MIAYFYDILNINIEFRHVAQFLISEFVDVNKSKKLCSKYRINCTENEKQSMIFVVSL